MRDGGDLLILYCPAEVANSSLRIVALEITTEAIGLHVGFETVHPVAVAEDVGVGRNDRGTIEADEAGAVGNGLARLVAAIPRGDVNTLDPIDVVFADPLGLQDVGHARLNILAGGEKELVARVARVFSHARALTPKCADLISVQRERQTERVPLLLDQAALERDIDMLLVKLGTDIVSRLVEEDGLALLARRYCPLAIEEGGVGLFKRGGHGARAHIDKGGGIGFAHLVSKGVGVLRGGLENPFHARVVEVETPGVGDLVHPCDVEAHGCVGEHGSAVLADAEVLPLRVENID